MASQTATIINLVNTVLGAGMLALPYAFRAQGVLLALFSLIFGAFTTGLGMIILGYASGFLPPGTASFFSVAKITQPSLAILFDVAIGLKCFGVCTSYLVIIGNLMPMVTDFFNFHTSQLFWLVVATGIITPLSFKRSLESLKTASLIALSSVVYLVIIVVGHYLKGDTVDQRGSISIVAPQDFQSVVSTTPIIVFAFTCAQNMFSAVNELNEKNMKSIIRVSVACVSVSVIVYITVGLTGYLSFGNNVTDNVISMYAQSVWSTLGRFAIVILVLFSYPIMSHPARTSIMSIIKAYRQYRAQKLGDAPTRLLDTPATPEDDTKEHIIITSAILICSFVLANTLNSLELILSFVGATGATSVSFMLPGIFGYSLASSEMPNRLTALSPARRKLLKIASILLFLWGALVAVLAIIINIVRIKNGQT